MPRENGQGPEGEGPKTGRGLGRCGREKDCERQQQPRFGNGFCNGEGRRVQRQRRGNRNGFGR